MKDGYERNIDYLRVSITDRCNLRCRYCMPVEPAFIPHENVLRYEEILRICRLAVETGIRRVRITGGEPLVRKGCLDLMAMLREIPGLEGLAITTNGVLLAEAVPRLRELKIDSVNVSLDTLQEERFRTIANRGSFQKVWVGIMAAVDAGLSVKINCVPQRGVNEDELEEIAALASRYPVDVRFIEMMPLGYGANFQAVAGDQVLERLRRVYPGLHPFSGKRGYGPARYYEAPALLGKLGLISAVSHCFCQECNRVRLTSEGLLKPCLYYGDGVDLRTLIREGAGDDELREAIERGIQSKPRQHGFHSRRREEERIMSQIGG